MSAIQGLQVTCVKQHTGLILAVRRRVSMGAANKFKLMKVTLITNVFAMRAMRAYVVTLVIPLYASYHLFNTL